MKSLATIVFILLYCILTGYSQTTRSDSLSLDSLNYIKPKEIIFDLKKAENDSVQIDSLLKTDTLKLIESSDSLQIKGSRAFSDTIQFSDSTEIKKDSVLFYNKFMDQLSDSLIFEKPDSVFYVLSNFEKNFQEDSLFSNDTIDLAVKKLLDYRRNLKVESAIKYLQERIDNNTLFYSNDSVYSHRNDSILNTLKYLINSMPEDSLKLAFTNLKNDSVFIEVKESEIDSVHFRLYDNRGEYAILWIKKCDDELFNLVLQEGVYIEKTKKREAVKQKLDTYIEIPGLKKIKLVNIVIPIWKYGGSADIKLNQGYISESWAEGGESSLALLSILKYNVNYTYGKKRSFDADLEYRLGYLKAGDNDMQKNDDKFELNLKYGRSAFKNWYYSGLLNFKSQILKGYEYVNDTAHPISEFLSPAHIVFSLGMDYKPSNKLTVLISPLTSKFTIVADTINYDQTRFGLEKDEKIRKELGAYVKAISKIKVKDYIILENKINFFTNYVDNPQNIDVDWEMNLAVKLTEYIQMSINTHLIYDDDTPYIKDGIEKGAKVQFKELFGIGFKYTF